jgi:hypothetical protein
MPHRELVLFITLVIVVWTLLPIVPAVLTYLVSPKDKIDVGGPIGQLTVRAGGAFAAYLVVLLALTPVVWKFADFLLGMLNPFSVVEAEIVLINKEGKTANDRLTDISATLDPDTLIRRSGRQVHLRMPGFVKEQWPHVRFHIPAFGGATVDLRELQMQSRPGREGRELRITEGLLIKELESIGVGDRPRE